MQLITLPNENPLTRVMPRPDEANSKGIFLVAG